MEELIFGINPVLETLRSDPKRIHKILLLKGPLAGKKKEVYFDITDFFGKMG